MALLRLETQITGPDKTIWDVYVDVIYTGDRDTFDLHSVKGHLCKGELEIAFTDETIEDEWIDIIADVASEQHFEELKSMHEEDKY